MLDVMYRMGFRGKAKVHGFRSVASTVLNESGLFQPDWIKMQLAHSPRGIRGVYNSAKYLIPRRSMMKWWADYLDAAEAAAPTPAGEAHVPEQKKVGALDWFQSSW